MAPSHRNNNNNNNAQHASSEQSPSSPTLIAPDCCYLHCMDIDFDLFSWTGLTSSNNDDDDNASNQLLLDPSHPPNGTIHSGTHHKETVPPSQQAHPLYQRSRTLSHHRSTKTYDLAGPKLRLSQSSLPLGKHPSKRRSLLKSSRSEYTNNSHPPPVIALSRSSFSTGSSNSESSTLESTQVDGDAVNDADDDDNRHHDRTIDLSMRPSSSWHSGGGGYEGIANSLYRLSKVKSASTFSKRDKEHSDRRSTFQQQQQQQQHAKSQPLMNKHFSTPHLIENDDEEEDEDENDQEIQEDHDRDYATLHELLINSLFEDAKARQQLAQQSPPPSPSTPDSPSRDGDDDDDEGYATPTHSHKTVSIANPESTGRQKRNPSNRSNSGGGGGSSGGAYRLKRKTSNQSASSWNSRTSLHSKHSKYSKTSRASSTSTKSDLLTPSSHQFKRSLGKRRKIHALPLLQALRPRRYRRKKFWKTEAMSPTVSGSSSPHVVTPSSRRDDTSSCASNSTFATQEGDQRNVMMSLSTTSASSFLEEWCDLQKDSGKGYAPGTSVTAHGKDDSMIKLVEKMDVLAEIENDGAYANAVLTRIPAKVMSCRHGGSDSLGSQSSQTDANGYVETRSMLAVKMGLLSIKYGILVHWNKGSGLAELIVLRKMCSESFMKPGSSKGSWRKRMKHRTGRTGSLGNSMSFATVDTMSTENGPYDSFGLDPIDSYTNRIDDSFG